MNSALLRRLVRPFTWWYLAVIAGGVLFRVAYISMEVDVSRDYYWEYGEIAKNVHAGKGYSLFHADAAGGQSTRFDPSAETFPSAYMPPAYVFFLWPFFFIESIVTRSAAVLAAQIVISALTAVALFEFTERYVHQGAGLWAAAIYSFLPELVYGTSSFTPTVHYHLGIIVLLYLLQRDLEIPHFQRSVLVAVICVLLIFFRSEFAAFACVALVFLSRVTSVRHGILAAVMILLMHLPWQVRNYTVFDAWVPLTTSGGLNFYRGHNGLALGAWGEDFISEAAKKIPEGPRFELDLSALYFTRAMDFIRSHPLQDLQNAGKKALHYWFLDPEDERSWNPWYAVPWFLLLAIAVFGAVQARMWQTHRLALVYLVYATAVAVTFFVLPRYQSMMKVVLVPFAAMGAHTVWSWMRTGVRGLSSRRLH